MKFNLLFRIVLVISVLSLNISCDQVSKSLIRKNLRSYNQKQIIGNNFIITKVENSGAFLSFGQNLSKPLKLIVLRILPIVILLLALAYLFIRKNLTILFITGICFIIGGGIGNLYDRLFHGSVTDFMHIDLGFFHTGIFNFADVSIMTGLFLLIIQQIKNYRRPNLETENSTN
jgi:signal peptidase II